MCDRRLTVSTYPVVHSTTKCYVVALSDLGIGNYLGAGVRIVFVSLGRRTCLRRETRGFRVRHEPRESLP